MPPEKGPMEEGKRTTGLLLDLRKVALLNSVCGGLDTYPSPQADTIASTSCLIDNTSFRMPLVEGERLMIVTS